MMRDNKHFEPKDYPRPVVPHFDNTYFINGTFDVSGHNGGHESHCNNYASSIAISPYNPIVMDFAGNLFNINDLNMTIDLTDIIDLNEPEEPTIPTIPNQKNPNYKSSNGF